MKLKPFLFPASSASGENSSPEDEPRAKIIKAPYSGKGKTKFASMSNLTEDFSTPSKPSPPPRNDLNKTPTPSLSTTQTPPPPPAVKVQRRSQSAMQTPLSTELKPVTIDQTDASLAGYSTLRPQTAFHPDNNKSTSLSKNQNPGSSSKCPHDHKTHVRGKENLVSSLQRVPSKHEAAPHIAAAGTAASEETTSTQVSANENRDPKPANQSAVNEKPQTRTRVNAAKPPPSPVRSQTMSPASSHEKQPSILKQKMAPKAPYPGSSESAVSITPLVNQSNSSSQNRFGFDRSTPKPDKKDASEGQFTAITGSAIVIAANNHDEDEPSTFMEYDVSNASSLRKGHEETTSEIIRRQGVIPEEEFLALQEMLDYAAERIQFSEHAKQEANREKNLIISEISKTELKCMTEVEELSRVFFKHVQDLQSRLMDSEEAGPSNALQVSEDPQNSNLGKDIKTKRLNEMKLRGRIALKQLKQELRSAWTQNREMMGKIALLSHSEMASMPLHDRRGQVDNMYENVDEEMRTERDLSSTEDTSAVVTQDSRHVNKSLQKLAQREESQYSVASPSANQKADIGMPKNVTPGHVLEFLRKFLASNDISVLEKTHVQIVFKALDQAYSDQQKLKTDIENLKNNHNEQSSKTSEENALKANEQIQEYKNKVIKLRNRLAAISEENEHLKSKNETLQQFAHNAHSVIEATREKVMERDKFEQQCHVLKQNLARMESQIAENDKNFRGTLANLRQELREALDGKKHFENEINKLLQQNQRGASGGVPTGLEGVNLMERLQQLERERLEAEARAEALAENLNVLTSRMEAQEYQIHHDKCTIDKLRRDLELLQKQTQLETQPQYQNLVSQVKHLEMKLQTTETRLAETVCERDQFKFLYDLTLQKVKAYDEKSSKHVSKAEKKLMKQNEAALHGMQDTPPKKNSALTLLEKKLLNKGSSSKNNSHQNLPQTSAPQTTSGFGSGFNNPGYGTSSAGGLTGGESEKTSLNSNITVASSTGATVGTTSASSAKMNHRPKLVSPRIAKSPVPPQITYHSQSAETITPLTPGKLKGKWHAL